MDVQAVLERLAEEYPRYTVCRTLTNPLINRQLVAQLEFLLEESVRPSDAKGLMRVGNTIAVLEWLPKQLVNLALMLLLRGVKHR